MKKNNESCPPGNIARYIQELDENPEIARQLAHHRLIPPKSASFGENRIPWSAAILKILKDKNIKLYTHQTLATDYIRSGRSVVVSTPTASGKSLIYNLPFYEKYLEDPDSKALYLFPLKALAQDQLSAFTKLGESWPIEARPSAALYDGDTTDWQRKKIRREPPAALLTNPEMLHLSFLPYHESWTSFLANLSFVIVDEAHTYRGIFGSHMAQIFRRLNRICRRYGSDPVYIFCSATVGNPRELAENLSGKTDIKLVQESGAPKSPLHFIFADPEKAASTFAIDLLKKALDKDLRVIVYCQSRRMTELLSVWAMTDSEQWKGKISAYRAGFLPEERREIEARMSDGDLRAVISTSALELGIDIGGLDLCILLGYPGTIMQTLQRGGRVGRSGREAAVIVVAGEDALDQYFIRHPEDFFDRGPERAVVNPYNPAILERHLECAAAELRLEAKEEWLKVPEARDAISRLENAGLLTADGEGSAWAAIHKRPHARVDLRGSGHTYSIENEAGAVIGAIDAFRAWKETHPGAVYIHHGKNYLIDLLDDGRMRVLAREAQVKWFTRTRGKKTTDILEERERRNLGRCLLVRGKLKIQEDISAYEKRSCSGNRLLTITPLDAPPFIFETEGIFLVIPDNIRKKLENNFIHFMGSIHALEHALIGLLPLEIMADRNDFGGISVPLHPQLGLAAVFIYDGLPGGAGLTASAFDGALELLKATYKAIGSCPCELGCPSCIQSPKCGAGNRPLSKAGVLALLEEILAPGTEGLQLYENLEISPAPQSRAKIEKRSLPPLPCPSSDPEQTNRIAPSHFVVFDVETRRSAQEVGGWNNARDMGISVAVCYDSVDDEYYSYTQEQLPELFRRLEAADLVVGFNSLKFDYQVLAGASLVEMEAEDRQKDIYSLPSLDIFKCVHDRTACNISLDNLGGATLQTRKSTNGLQALKWWKEGKLAEIAEYCRKDVEITKDLYLYGLRRGFLFYTNKAGMPVKVEVDFSQRK